MRFHALCTASLCLLALIPLRATAASTTTASPAGWRAAPAEGWQGLEVSPRISLPLPAASANQEEIGLDAGLSISLMETPNTGVGFDAAYHYWPVSAEFKREFNELLRDQTWNTLMLGGGTWGLQVVQLGAHFRISGSAARGVRPWLLFGGGIYQLDPNTTGYSGDAGFFRVTAVPLKRTQHFGGSITVGADLFGGKPARMGLNATYHFVNCKERFGADLHVFALGAHAQFGR